MPTQDVLRAHLAETLAEHFPEASPTQIGLTVIALRDDVLHYVHDVLAERGIKPDEPSDN